MRASVMDYYTGKCNNHIDTTGLSPLMSNFNMVSHVRKRYSCNLIYSEASRRLKVGQLWNAILNFFICGSKSLWSAF